MSKNLVVKILMDAHDKASGALGRIKASASGLSKELTKTSEELKALSRAQKLVEDRVRLDAKIRETTREMNENRKAVSALNAEIKKNGTASKAQTAEMERLASVRERLNEKQKKQTESLEVLNKKLSEHKIKARDAAAAQHELDRRTEAATAKMDKQKAAAERIANRKNAISNASDMAGRIQGVAAKGMAGGVALGGLTAKAVSAGMSEEDAMMGVIRQVQGLKNADNSLNHAEIAKIRTEIQGLSNELPVATTQIMEMYEAGARMNVPREELAQYVKTAAAAATAFDAEDMGGLAENLGRINANFKLTAEQGRELADVINYLDDNAISSGAAIIDYMNRVSGSMGLAKISEKNVAALGSTLLSQGVDDSTAAGAVSALFTRLSTAPDMKPVREALKDIGLDAKTVQKGMVEDANATVMQIVEAVKKMPKEEQAGILKGLAGGEYNKVFAGLISNTEEWRRQMELANSQDAIGSMAREFETRMGAMSSKWQVFKNQLFNAEAGAGQALFGMLSGLMTTVGGWLNAITRWTAANPQLAAGIMKVVAVGSMLLVGLSGLALVVSTLLVPMVMAKFAILSLGSSALSAFGMLKSGLMILRTAMMANPIVLFVSLAVGALILLWANWDKVKAALIAGWNWLKNVFRQNPLLAAFTGPIGAIVGLIANFDRLKAGLTAGWNWLKNVFRQNPLIAAFTGPIGVIAGLIANFDRLKAAARSAVEWVRRAISGGGATPASVGVPNRGFSVGGYTGAGRSNEAAGIVHKGEVVFSQNDVSRFGGWRIVDALRRGGMAALNWGRGKMGSLQSFVRGSASGLARPSENGRPAPSLVGAVAVPDGFNRSGGGVMPMNISININGGNSSPVDIAKEVARQIEQVARNQARRARSMFADKD